MTENFNPFYKLLKGEVTYNVTSELTETFHSVNRDFIDACELALKQRLPVQWLVWMRHRSFRSAGYALMIEDNPDHKSQTKRKFYTPWCSDLKSSPQHNLKCRYFQRNFEQITWHFLSLHTVSGKQRDRQLT